METKDQLNQNPVEENNSKQEENSQPNKTDVNPEETVENSSTEKDTIKEKTSDEVKVEESIPDVKPPVENTTADPTEEKKEVPKEKPAEEVTENPAEDNTDSTKLKEEDVIEEVKDIAADVEKKETPIVVEEVVAEEPKKEAPKEKLAEEVKNIAAEVDTKETPIVVEEVEAEEPKKEVPKEKLAEEVKTIEAEAETKETPIVVEEVIAEDPKKEVVADTDSSPVPVEEEKKTVIEANVDPEITEKTEADKKPEVIESNTEEHVKDEEDEEDDDIHDEEDEHKEQIDYESLSLEELVSNLEEILVDGVIEKIKKNVALIKVSFLKQNKERQEKKFENFIAEGGDKEDYSQEKDDLEVRFQAAFQIYHDKRKQFLAEQEKIKQQNLEGKNLVLVELKALIESEESLKHTYDEFKNLQEKWKNIGMVPKAEVNNLWQNYHFYVEKFFDKVKINKELRDLDLKKNMESKIELCEKAEELLIETSVLKSFKKLQQYHTEWKDIGPVPQDKKDEIWERFKTTTDKINDLRREHYNSLRDEQKKSLEAKVVLCEKAEELLQLENTSIKDWQENTDKISELLKIWKTIGQAPRQQNDEIWERFKTSLDTFFAGKKEYFQQIKDEQMNHYNLKLNLCTQAEAIKGNTDWKKTTQELISLQKEWKSIGPVPKRHSDKIWKRFRAACDEFFNSKSDYFSNIKQHEADNQNLKEEIIKKVEGFDFGTDKNENLDVLKGFQREWTEIGHVPFKEKDRLQNAFRDAINKQFDKLKISRAEAQAVNYKQRFENLKENPNANRILYNERNFLATKRKKLEDEINLLENNMGFFAQSKKADLLKLELSKKIEKARSEVLLIIEKIKFLEREAK